MEQASNIESILRKIQHDQNVISKSTDFMKFVDERGFRPGLRVLRNLQEDLNGFYKRIVNLVQFGFKIVMDLLVRIIEAIKGIKPKTASSSSKDTSIFWDISIKGNDEYNIFERLKKLFNKLNELRKVTISPIISLKDFITDKILSIKNKVKRVEYEKAAPTIFLKTNNAKLKLIGLILTMANLGRMVVKPLIFLVGRNKEVIFMILSKMKMLATMIARPLITLIETNPLMALRLLNTLKRIDLFDAKPMVNIKDKASNKLSKIKKVLGAIGKVVASPIIAVKSIAPKALGFGANLLKTGFGVANAGLGLLGIDPNQSIKDVLKKDAEKGMVYANSINKSISSIQQSFQKPFNSFLQKVLIQLEPYLKAFADWLNKNQQTLTLWANKGANIIGKFVGVFIQQWPRIQKSIKSAWVNMQPVFDMLIVILRTVISWVIANLPTFAAIFDKVFPVACKIIKTVINVLGILWKAWESMWPIISEILQTAWSIIEPIINLILQAVDLLGKIFEKVFPVILDIVTKVWNQLKPVFDGIKKGIEFVGGLFGSLKNTLFGEEASINVNGKVDGKHAAGLSYVPFDGYIAELHKGERVLTASESKSFSSLGTSSGIVSAQKSGNTFNISINGVNKSTSEIMNELVARIKEAAGTMGEVAYSR